MIDFYINGQKVDVQLEDEQTIGDVLKSFEKTGLQVSGLYIAGKKQGTVSPDNSPAAYLKSITQYRLQGR